MNVVFEDARVDHELGTDMYYVHLMDGDTEIGTATIQVDRFQQWCVVWSVKVDEDRRGKGAGTFMMEEVISFLKDKDKYKGVYLWADPGREDWYERLGFTCKERDPKWLTKYVMEFE
jgi:GNAT superfamily N-acetyltransferase